MILYEYGNRRRAEDFWSDEKESQVQAVVMKHWTDRKGMDVCQENADNRRNNISEEDVERTYMMLWRIGGV